MKKNFLSIICFLLVSVFSSAHGETIRILSTNDMHSALEKMPQLAFIVDSLRAIDPTMLVLSAGDNRTGNPYNDRYKPAHHDFILPVVVEMHLCAAAGTFHNRIPP